MLSVGVFVCMCVGACTSSHHSVTSSGSLKRIRSKQPTVNSEESIDGYRFPRKNLYVQLYIHLHDYNFQHLRSQIATSLIVM